MEGVALLLGESTEAALIDLHVIGPLRASARSGKDVLPNLRKARALFAVLALSEAPTLQRRFLAQLLWSRNDPAQALARLRDTLRTLRQSLSDANADADILEATGERVGLRPGMVRVITARDGQDRGAFTPSTEIATDLDGIDPALDDWLRGLRARFRASERPSAPAAEDTVRNRSTVLGHSAKRGSVLGVRILNAAGLPGDDFLAFALTEEIATSLSKIRGLIVIASQSVAAGLAAGRNLAQELGLDFLLDGSLQRLGDRLRVAVKLVDAMSGAVCWTSHFDYNHGDAFHVQQDVAALVTAGLEPELPSIAAEQIKRAGGAVEGAYALLLRAISQIHLLDRTSYMEAGDLLARAIDLEPEYSAAYSWLALWHVFLVGQGWARDPRASIARAGEVAEHAVMLDPNDARGLAIAGHVRAFLHRRLDEAIPLHERALAINPSLPLAWHLSGVAQAYKGNLTEARRRIDQCRRLAPRDPHSFFADGAAIIVELLSRNHEEAALIGRRVTQLHPRFSAGYKPYLSALGHLAEDKEAALIYRRLLQLEPDFTTRAFRATSPFAVREHTDHYVAGLSLAGVP